MTWSTHPNGIDSHASLNLICGCMTRGLCICRTKKLSHRQPVMDNDPWSQRQIRSAHAGWLQRLVRRHDCQPRRNPSDDVCHTHRRELLTVAAKVKKTSAVLM